MDSMTRTRWPAVCAVAAAVVAVLVAAGVAVFGANRGDPGPAPQAAPAPGDCVVVAPDEHRELHSTRTDCATKDFSFIVSTCEGYGEDTTFPEPFADPQTAALCLVPNFTVGQCYEFATPSGMFAQTDCDTESYAVTRIDAKHETADADACPAGGDSRPMPFPSVPLTYCYTSMGAS